jgi:hypothetical protein
MDVDSDVVVDRHDGMDADVEFDDDAGVDHHDEMDKAVLGQEIVTVCKRTKNFPDSAYLLAVIVATYKDKMDGRQGTSPDYNAAKHILNEHKDTVELLQKAWSKGQFKEIRHLGESLLMISPSSFHSSVSRHSSKACAARKAQAG